MTGSEIKSEIFAYLNNKGWVRNMSALDARSWIDPLTGDWYMFHAAFVVELSREIDTPKEAA